MRRLYPLLVLLVLAGRSALAQTRPAALFPIRESGRWGFVDSTGAVAIAPRFDNVQAFAEGLAPVLSGGYYGFIDAQGRFVVPPTQQYATGFRQGLAAVLREGRPALLDRTGRLVPGAGKYGGLQWLSAAGPHGRWVGWRPHRASSARMNWGQLLGADGRPIGARFGQAGELGDNRLVVQERRARFHRRQRPPRTGILDGQGRWVVPYGRFYHVSAFHDGVALATLARADSMAPATQAIIDTTGRLVARLPASQRVLLFDAPTQTWTVETDEEETTDRRYHHPVFSDGVARVRLAGPGRPLPNDSCEIGLLDRQGHLLARFAGLSYVSPFRQGRAWARTTAGEWFLVNKAGQRLSAEAADEVYTPLDGPTFASGGEVVKVAQGFAVLDSTGRIINRLSEPAFAYETCRPTGALLQFMALDSTNAPRTGFWNWRTGQLASPLYTELDPNGFRHGLLAVVEAGRLGYLNAAGRYVWRAPAAAGGPLRLDYQRRSFYPVASATALPQYAGYGGWACSGNQPRQLAGAPNRPGQLRLHVAPEVVPGGFSPGFDGHRVALTNSTADTVVFDAQDSSLYLTVQAQDARGQWRAIEYTPHSWCGNSCHRVYLAPSQQWQLAVPAYAGGQPTQLRLRLVRRQNYRHPRQSAVVYSNPFPGSVNAAQFWRQEGHQAQGIMDSYDN